MYLDGDLVLERKDTVIHSTVLWIQFNPQEMGKVLSLKSGIHELKFVSHGKDYNIDCFTFKEAGEYIGTIISDEITNEGTVGFVK